jgi:hypothetical protein
MGILTDLFVATPEDALLYESPLVKGPPPATRIDVVELKHMTDIEFSMLWALLAGEEWDVEAHALETVACGADDETWLFRFQAPLVSRLAALTPLQVARAAESWWGTGQLDAAPEEIEPLVTDLTRLAGAAGMTGKGLYLWGSL